MRPQDLDLCCITPPVRGFPIARRRIPLHLPGQNAMKSILTFLFLATVAVTFGLAFLFVPETARNDKFWLAIGSVGAAEFLTWLAFTYRETQRGEQAVAHARGSMIASTLVYFCATLALGLVAISPVSFKVLLAFHMVAFLIFLFLAGFAIIGTKALATTDEANRIQ